MSFKFHLSCLANRIMHTDHYLIIDFEATCSNDNSVPRDEMEIIEIGAVIVVARTLQPVDEFQTFVKPVQNPELTNFCLELTQIRQDQVDQAPTFPEALEALINWVTPFPNFVFCSWGNYDRNQLENDCDYHQVAYPFDARHLNLKEQFASMTGKRKKGVPAALKSVGLTFQGCHHRGIDDARNIANLMPYIVAPTI